MPNFDLLILRDKPICLPLIFALRKTYVSNFESVVLGRGNHTFPALKLESIHLSNFVSAPLRGYTYARLGKLGLEDEPNNPSF